VSLLRLWTFIINLVVRIMSKRKVKWLNLGADLGPTSQYKRQKGWTYNDLYRSDHLNEDDIVYDAAKIDEVVEEGSVEKLVATHLLEHFSHRDTQDILERWFKIIAPGGQIYIEVPNFDFHIQLAMQGRIEEAIRYNFGGQEDEGDYHKTAFSADSLRKYLSLAGFTDIEINPQSSISARAYKITKKAE